jgi:hypothetical protein
MTDLNTYPILKYDQFNSIDDVSYSHPSFGNIDIQKRGSNGLALFETVSSGDFSYNIKISSSDISYGLGKSWFHKRDLVTEVTLSEYQFSEFIMTEGAVVPCTFSYREDHGNVEFNDHTEPDSSVELTVDGLAAFSDTISRIELKLEAISKKTGALKKADKNEFILLTSELAEFVLANADKMKKLAVDCISNIDESTNKDIQNHLDKAVSKTVDKIKTSSAGGANLLS